MSNGIAGLTGTQQDRMRTITLPDGSTQEIPESVWQGYQNFMQEKELQGKTEDPDFSPFLSVPPEAIPDMSLPLWLKTMQPFQRSGGIAGYLARKYNPMDTINRMKDAYNPMDFVKAFQEDPDYRREIIKAPVREAISTPIRSFKGWANVATPGKDTKFEETLRGIVDKGFLPSLESDPRYQGLMGPAISGAMGQVAAYAGVAGLAALALGTSATVALPIMGTVGLASLVMGAGVGLSTQEDKINEYELRSGRDLPWLSELSRLVPGAAIGLTEVMPLKVGRYGFNKKFWPVQRQLPGRMTPVMDVLKGGIGEGTQEALAGVGQTIVSRTYDEKAFNNWAREAEQEFVVGGAAGALASLARAMLPGKYISGGDRTADDSAEVELRRFMQTEGYALLESEEYIQNVGQRLRDADESEEVIKAWEGIEASIKRPISKNLLIGLQNSHTDFKALEREYIRFENYYKALEESVLNSSLDPDAKVRVASLIRDEGSRRIEVMGEILGNAKRHNYDNGGLTNSEQYQQKKEDRIKLAETARASNAEEVAQSSELSNSDWLYSVMSPGGLEGGFALEEILGIHGGRGSQDVDTSIDEESLEFLDEEISIPVKLDQTKAASDNGSFSPSQVARALVSNIGLFRGEMLPLGKQKDATKSFDGIEESKRSLKAKNKDLHDQNPILDEDGNVIQANMETIFVGDIQIQEEGEALDNTDKRFHIAFLNNQLKNASDILANNERLSKVVAKQLGFKSSQELNSWLTSMLNVTAQHDANAGDTIAKIKELTEKNITALKYSDETGTHENVKINKIEESLRQRFMRQNNIDDERDIMREQVFEIEGDARNQEAQLNGSLTNKVFSSNIPAQDVKRIVDLLIANKDKRNTVFGEVLSDRIDADVDLEERNRIATLPILASLNEETRELVDGVRKRIIKNPKKAIEAKDIINLLRSKNYFLRGDGSLEGISSTIKNVAYAGGTGVDSLPFRRLLRDLAAVDQWSDATPEQKALIYFSLARIPKVRVTKENYLPDMYADEVLDIHVDQITSHLVNISNLGTSPETSIAELSSRVKSELDARGVTFDEGVFGEAVARLLESKVLVADGDTDRIRLDLKAGTEISEDDYWVSEAKPEMIKDILKDKEHAQNVQAMTDEYNEKRAKTDRDARPVTTRQFVDMLAPYLADSLGMRQLDSMGLLGSGTRSMLRKQPVASLMSQSATAREVYKDLILKGAIPSTMDPTSQELRQTVIEVTGKKLRLIKDAINDVINSLDLREDMKYQLVAEADSEFNILTDVLIAGKDMGDASSVLRESGPIGEIIYNLSSLDPRSDMKTIGPEVMKAIAKPAIFDMLQRMLFNQEERQQLGKFVANTTVPDFINPEAANHNLTWLQAKAIEMTKENGVAPNPEDALMHAVSDFLAEMISNKDRYPVQMKILSNAMNKVHTKAENFLGGIARVAQQAEIASIWNIYTAMSTGKTAQRARDQRGLLSDQKELIPGLPAGAVRLMRYASLDEKGEYRVAMALRDSTTNEADRKMQQAKVDAISKRILSRRNIIQKSAPIPPDEIKRLSDEAEYNDILSGGNKTVIPLVGKQLDLELDADGAVLGHTLDVLAGRAEPYTMSSEHTRFFARQTIFDDQTIKLADAQNIEGKEPFIKVLEVLGEAMSRGDSPADAVRIFDEDIKKQIEGSLSSKLTGMVFDVNRPLTRLEQEVATLFDVTAISALSSTLWAKTVADMAGNFTKSMMIDGPLTYTGASADRGEFRYVDVRSDFLKEKYGMDKIPGLKEIFAIIDGAPKDEMVATLYGLGKQLQWAKEQHDFWKNRKAWTSEQRRRKEEAIHRYRSDRKRMVKITKKVDPDAVYKEGDVLPKNEKGKVLKKVGDRLSAKAYEKKLNDLIAHVESTNSPVVKFWDVLNEFTNHSLKTAYNGELITKERYDALTEMPYVPRYIAPEFLEGGEMDISRVIGDDMMSRQLKASESPMHDDLFANNARNAQAVVRDTMNNVWHLRAIRDLIALGRARDVTGKVSMSEAKSGKGSEKYIRVKMQGVDRIFEVDDKPVVKAAMQIGFSPERLWSVMVGVGGEPVKDNWIWKALRFPSDAVRQLVTRSTGFIQRNLLRDGTLGMLFHGFSDGGVNFFMTLLDKAADISVLTSGALLDKDKSSDTQKDVRAFGGDPGFDIMKTTTILNENVEELWVKAIIDKDIDTKSLAGKAIKALKEYMSPDRWGPKEIINPLQWVPLVWHMMGTISSHVELAGRASIWEMQMAKTGNRETANQSAIEQLNYGKGGGNPFIRIWASMAPFINGSLQGLNVSWRTVFKGDTVNVPTTGHYGYTRTEWDALPFWKRDRAKIWGRLITMGVGSSMLTMMTFDDEDYQRQTEMSRGNYLLIPMGDGTYFKYPVPHELGVITHVIPTQITRWVMDEGHGFKDATRETWDAIKRGVRYNMMPQAISPLYDMWNNEDRYRQQPIVNYWDDQLSPILQQGPGTGPIARGLAEFANGFPWLRDTPLSSPEKVAYGVNAAIGPIGMMLKETAEALAMEQHGMSTIGTKYDMDDWQDQWGQNMFMSRKGLGGDQQSVYGWLEKVGKQARDYNAMVEAKWISKEKSDKFYEEHKVELQAYGELQTIAKALQEYRVQEQNLRNKDEQGRLRERVAKALQKFPGDLDGAARSLSMTPKDLEGILRRIKDFSDGYQGVGGQELRARDKEGLRQDRIKQLDMASEIIKELVKETGGRGPWFMP